jgi:hypothetical protein
MAQNGRLLQDIFDQMMGSDPALGGVRKIRKIFGGDL